MPDKHLTALLKACTSEKHLYSRSLQEFCFVVYAALSTPLEPDPTMPERFADTALALTGRNVW